MKKIFVLALAAASVAACKKQSETQVADNQAINFTTSAVSITKGLTPDYEGNTLDKDNFFLGDQIGVYLANSDQDISAGNYTFDATTAKEAVNFGYTLAYPFWSPLNSSTGKLMFPKAGGAYADKAQLFAYFPYSGISGSPVKVKASPNDVKSVLDFTYAANQSSNATLRFMDLLLAQYTNAQSPTSTGLELEFNHMMTKLNFQIKVVTTGTVVSTEKRYLRAIAVRGPEVNVQNATFDVVSGVLTPATIQNTPGTVYFMDGTTGASLMKADVTGTATVMTNGTTSYNDLLLYPFAQNKDVNSFLFFLSEDDSTPYTTLADLETAAALGNVEMYRAAIDEPTIGGTVAASKNRFEAGVANKYVVTIDVNTKAVNITSVITPWDKTDDQNITAE